ncbi:hypothetical protein [Melittangium boletus]|uniref:Uncharacterized protein n=1 Tax=Melittangium boletus DSM 14713 TaxID=1294270 RepID=A0A250INZ4_9BACT|nr:hypothetical protein [Melittangium boletus]ATB32897.1 hypothetical protein MEBOL_006386 [Melittangium boletus DSM 14713]
MNPLFILRHTHHPALDIWAWWNIIGEVGSFLWVVAYALIVRQCHQQKTYGIPMVAICLNMGWEVLTAWVLPNPVEVWLWLERAWSILDLFILGQLLRYGRAEQKFPETRQYFYPLIGLTLVLSFCGQYSFIKMYQDNMGFMDAFMINLVMSILFVGLYYERRETRQGLSVPVAWLKMLGSLGTGIQSQVVVRSIDHMHQGVPFLTFLSLSILLFDCAYIYLLMKPVRSPAGQPVLAPAG